MVDMRFRQCNQCVDLQRRIFISLRNRFPQNKNLFDVTDIDLPLEYRLIRNCIMSRGNIKPGYAICDIILTQLGPSEFALLRE